MKTIEVQPEKDNTLIFIVVAAICIIVIQFVKEQTILAGILGVVALLCMGLVVYNQFKQLL